MRYQEFSENVVKDGNGYFVEVEYVFNDVRYTNEASVNTASEASAAIRAWRAEFRDQLNAAKTARRLASVATVEEVNHGV